MQTFVAEWSLQCFTASMSETLKLSRNEPHDSSVASRLNWLRAGVLGANDGIVSVAATVVGVAGVTAGTVPEAANRWLAPLVKDLQASRARCVVIAGHGQPPAVHLEDLRAHLSAFGRPARARSRRRAPPGSV